MSQITSNHAYSGAQTIVGEPEVVEDIAMHPSWLPLKDAASAAERTPILPPFPGACLPRGPWCAPAAAKSRSALWQTAAIPPLPE